MATKFTGVELAFIAVTAAAAIHWGERNGERLGSKPVAFEARAYGASPVMARGWIAPPSRVILIPDPFNTPSRQSRRSL